MSKQFCPNSCVQFNKRLVISRATPKTNQSFDRRSLIGLTGISTTQILLQQEGAKSKELDVSICDKFGNESPQIAFISPFASPEPVYYPNWMFGEWNVKAVQKDHQKEFTFRLKFYSTFPDTFENQLKFNLGLAIPKAAIIADRAFNLQQICNTYLGHAAVDDIEYFPRVKNIRNLITASYQPSGDANQDRLPVKISIVKTEQDSFEINEDFCSSEVFRPVLDGLNNYSIYDIENVYKFTKQGIQQFRSSGEAAAIYDFDLDMTIVTPEEQGLGTGDFRCVENPKAIVQCA